MTPIESLGSAGDDALRERRLGDALAAYQQLTELDPERSTWWWRIARVREIEQDVTACREAVDRALELEGGATKLDERLLDSSPYELRSRRRIARFVRTQLAEIRRSAAELEPAQPSGRRRLFVYWAQGFEAAPALVRRCLDEVLVHHSADDVVLLTDANRDEWAPLPPDLTTAIGADRTKLSDALRLELLWRHGGVWLDATCLPVTDVLATTDAEQGFYAFEIRPRRLSSWLVSAPPADEMVGLLAAAQRRYWTHFKGRRPYYAIHQLFEALVLLDEGFAQGWQASPRPSADPPHALQFSWAQPYDEETYQRLLDGCWVHKLTYKYDPALAESGTILHRLLTDGPIRPEDRAGER